MTAGEAFLSLISNEIAGVPINKERGFGFDEAALYKIARKHALSHLLIGAIDRNGVFISEKMRNALVKSVKTAAAVEARMSELKKTVNAVFNGKNIDHVFLKGAVLRDFYPEPWMRTSCDLDVLINENDLDKAVAALVEAGFKTDGNKNYHDVSLYYGKMHLELHFSLNEDDALFDKVLSDVRDNLTPLKDNEYKETSEFFIFHHVAHAAYHFMHGGCGVRPIIDLYFILKNIKFDVKELERLLEKSELLPFYNAMIKLVDVWFCGGAHNDLTLKMQDYILKGGIYGSKDNAVSVDIAKKGRKKGKYIFSLVFLPYKNMCEIYPILKKHKILLPLLYFHRIIKKIFAPKNSSARKHFRSINSVTKQDLYENGSMLKDLGLYR